MGQVAARPFVLTSDTGAAAPAAFTRYPSIASSAHVTRSAMSTTRSIPSTTTPAELDNSGADPGQTSDLYRPKRLCSNQ
jgi:hypothetical protein